jgi:hypothetical protein
MRGSLSLRLLAAIAFVAAGALTFWACSSPPTVGATVSCGPFTGSVVVGPGGEKSVDVDGPSGICWKFTFVGADGADISTSTVAVPGHLQVPAGTVRMDFDRVPCPEPPELGGAPSHGFPIRST